MSLDDDIKVPRWIFRVSASLLVTFVALTALAWHVDRFADAGPPPEIISARPTLLVYERDGCGWCVRFRRNISPEYENSYLSSRVPMKYVQLAEQASLPYRLKYGVAGTPTSVLVDVRGREVGRIGGYPGGGAKTFLKDVEALLEKLPKEPDAG
ncbi:MAG: thioredoxin fold domain-containing protein [Hyphomicrobiaceae bacterium]